MVVIFSFNYVYFWGLVSSKVQSRSRKQNKHLQLLGFVDRFHEMDHRAIDTHMVHLHEHLLMPTDDPALQWQVSKLCQPLSTSHWKWFARESLWIPLPPWTISLPQKLPFGVEDHCDLHQPMGEQHSGLHQPWEAGAPGRVQRPTCILCWWLTLGVWAMVVQWPRLDVTDLEVKCVQWQYPHGSVSLAVEPVYFVLSYHGAPGLDVGTHAGCPNRLLWYRMTRWTLQGLHLRFCWSPDLYRHHPASKELYCRP